jgi:hypothetical protein
MTKFTTETGRTLVPEGHYVAMINNVKEKDIPGGYIIYEWSFESLVNDKTFHFSISLFSSQMADLLRALGATETTKNKFEWEDSMAIGQTIEFNVCHSADKKGTIREQLSDIKLLSPGPAKKDEIVW